MANYNYVAPIEYKSYSEMNKERLAAKAERDALKVQQFSAGDKQRQKYLDQLSGLKTEGWSTLHRDEFQAEVEEARRYIQNTPINQLDFGPVSDAIIRMQDLGDSHAKLRTGQTEYETHFGVNAVDPAGDTWDATTTYDSEGWEKRLNTFNNVGLINYSNGRGDFPNPNYDPKAEPGTEGSFRSVREMFKSQGIAIETGPDGKDYANVNGQQVPVNGGAFDVADGGFGNLWNGDRKTRETHTPGDTYLNFKANENGASVFTALGNDYFQEVKNEGMTADEAHDRLEKDVMLYLTGQDPSASLRASAIRMWEDKYNVEWEAMNEHIARSEAAGGDIPPIPETPWEMYAKAVADKAPFTPKPPGEDSEGRWNTSKRLWKASSTNKYLNLEEASTGRAMDKVGVKDKAWKNMLKQNLGGVYDDDDLAVNIQSIRSEIEDAENDSGNLNVTVPEGSIKYDGQNINRVTYYPDEDYVIIWRVDPDQGEQGPLPATSNWAYTTYAGGEAAGLPFQIIYKHKDGESSEGAPITQQYRDLRDSFALKMEEGSGFEDPLQALFDRAERGNLDQ
jgi:hypothetical protein